MDTYSNPFNPGAGVSPPELAGRSEVLEQAVTALERTKRGRHAKSLMVLGLRGVGKTVLLNEIGKEGWELVSVDSGDDDPVFYFKRPHPTLAEAITLEQRERYFSEWGVGQDQTP